MRRAAVLALAAALAGCGNDGRTPGASQPRRSRTELPAALQTCRECHARIVDQYAGHAMSDSLGAALPRERLSASLTRDDSGTRYELAGSRLNLQRKDGSHAAAQLVGRIGAGVMDVSLVGTPLAPAGAATSRLSFLPLELFADGQPGLAPFEHGPEVGLGQPVTAECLSCHTTGDVAALPGAAADAARRRVYPAHELGAQALSQLQPLACEACHGETQRHVAIMKQTLGAAPEDIGLQPLSELPAAAQRDVCSRCHLDGELRVELHPLEGYGPRAGNLLAERPVLVAAAPTRDFRFVAQVERLELSACFKGTPDMSCTSCHDPHRAAAAQGTAGFDAACERCHASSSCSRPAALTVAEVTGDPARSADGCVDCHVRRSQPYDLEHVRSADHWVRRRIERPETMPLRGQQDRQGALRVFDDGRLSAALATREGQRWSEGLVALGFWKLGRPADAAALLAQFPEPGSAAARVPSAPAGLVPLESSANFHFLRGLVLEAVGQPDAARAAYGDALTLDPAHPEARVNRASLRLDARDLAGALQDAGTLLAQYPRAEKGWNLRALAAAAAGDLPSACEALQHSVELWPCDAGTWHLLGQLRLKLGRRAEALDALTMAAQLDVSLPGLAADLAAAR
jgi:Tfp pilus assembly protein PilF